MANEVPDVVVPLTLVERMRATTGPDASRQEGAKIAVELVKALRPMTAGVVVSTPAGRVERALEVLAAG